MRAVSRGQQDERAAFPTDLIEKADESKGIPKRDLERLFKLLPIRKEVTEQLREEALHKLREHYIGRTFCLVKLVMLLSLLFVAWVGVGWWRISDAVLVALLTTTTANVIGILLIAFNWLFPKK